MSEIPLRSDREQRGENFADEVEGNRLTNILHRQGQKLADEISAVKDRENHRKSCRCASCSRLRRGEAERLVDDLNWTVDMLKKPEDRGKEELQVFDKENGKGWDLKLVKRSGGAGIYRPRLKP